MKGIDISMHNGNINFNLVKNDGVEVIIIKATEGVEYIDPNFESYYNACNSLGFNLGFYHFMSEKTDPAQQAIDFYNAIKNKNYNVKPILDIETNNYGRSREEISNRCLAFLTKFKELSGQDCAIYTGGYFGRDNLDDRLKSSYLGWIAHYGVDTPMETGFRICGHQYTETGRIAGINGNVDVNTFNDSILIDNSKPAEQPQQRQEVTEKIVSLQSILGIPCTGIWDDITDNKTHEVIPGIPYKTPQLTTWIQLRLGLTPDGIFYTKTESAVKQWQSEHGLYVDGLVGHDTLKSLCFA